MMIPNYTINPSPREFYEYSQIEKTRTYSKYKWSIIPFLGKNNGQPVTKQLMIIPTGSIATLYNKQFHRLPSSTEIVDFRRQIEQPERERLKSIGSHIKNGLPDLYFINNRKSVVLITAFNQPIANYQKLLNIAKNMSVALGTANALIDKQVDNFKLITKNLVIFITFSNNIKVSKNGRRLIRLRLTHVVVFSHFLNSLFNSYYISSLILNDAISDYILLTHVLNPLLQSGKIDSHIIFSSINLFFFNRLSHIFHIRKQFRELLLSLVSQDQLTMSGYWNLLYCIRLFKKFTGKIFYSKNTYPNQNELKFNIIESMQKYYNELLDIDSGKIIENNNLLGLSRHKIAQLVHVSSTFENEKLENLLLDMVKQEILSIMPSKGRAKRKYALNLDFYNIRDQLINTLLQVLNPDLDDVI